jgi:hypothetical protein
LVHEAPEGELVRDLPALGLGLRGALGGQLGALLSQRINPPCHVAQGGQGALAGIGNGKYAISTQRHAAPDAK